MITSWVTGSVQRLRAGCSRTALPCAAQGQGELGPAPQLCCPCRC